MADLGFDFPDDDYHQDAVFDEQQQEEEGEDSIESEVVPFADFSTQNDSLLKTMAEEQTIGDELEDELLADENMTPIERVYGFRENDALVNRILLAKELPRALEEITLSEAVEDVLPIMNRLAADNDDTVKETFASELDQALLYFYKV
ncbi:hypothetical protein CU098_012459 [Rhizopus stolonifer]|uniref:Uncharacterized protein n=1 Tax=Rhizopus stolonifer TaxID=4846 RepID=A0A367KRT7_RHIST|nr:hypothetical protein CU098_012459 [Rhizopus stolonifer]